MGLFKKAVASDSKLRLAIAGASGAGKTWTALAIATVLAPGKVALVDTEHGSASKYAKDFDFDVAEMHAPYKVEKFIQVIKEAASAGYEIIILDSLSHAWNGPGGVLEEVDKATKKYGGNSHYAWRDGTPLQQSLIDGIVTAPIHVIATMRSKEDYAETTENGRKTYRKVGTVPIQRDGMSYEFDVVFDMNLDHEAIVTKSRCSALADQVIKKPGAQVAAILADWLSGEPARPRPTNGHNAVSAPMAEQADVDFGKGASQNAPATSQTSQDDARGTNGHDDALNDGDAPAQHELNIISQWQGPQDAQTWAVMIGACDNDHHAKQSWIGVVRECRGYSEKNKQQVFLAFLRHQHEKIGAQQPVAEAA